MKSKIISFWSPANRSGCSTNTALFISYLSKMMDEMDKAVLFSINTNVDATDYITVSDIKVGIKSLEFLYENSEINSKEDVFSYTHRVAENIDILGTEKNITEIAKNFDKMIEILSMAYDYIILDLQSGANELSLKALNASNIIVLCLPQDKYICQDFIANNEVLEGKKSIFLISQFNAKNNFSKNEIEVILQREIYAISQDDKINQACYNKNIFSFIDKKSNVLLELDNLFKEVKRLINIDSLDITYEINSKSSNAKKADVTNELIAEPIKIIKEYKFIKAKNNIGILNLSEGAGATFLALSLACLLKEKKLDVTVVEIPSNDNVKHDIYSILNCDDEVPCIVDGVKYYINAVNNRQEKKWSDDEIIEHINTINRENASINLYDLGNISLLNSSINYLLNLLDCCIVVIDPLPYKLLQSNIRNEIIQQELLNKGVESIFVVNKFVDDLSKRDIENYLNCKLVCCIPFIKPTTIYAAYY